MAATLEQEITPEEDVDQQKSPHPSEESPSTARASGVSLESSSFSSNRSNASPRKPGDSPARSPRKRGNKIAFMNPPSAFHPDIHPPCLIRVQRALLSHKRETQLNRPERVGAFQSHFRDQQGRFILGGSSGGHYVGDLLGGLPHGSGQHSIPFPSPDKMHMLYDGEWKYGDKSGVGSIFYTNGEEYRGEVRQNKRWGCGWMRYKDDSFYAGDWLRGRRHGLGIHYCSNGNWYYGSFCKDSQDGWGTFYWPSIGRKFEGEWVVNQPYSGYYSQIDTKDSKMLGMRLIEYCPQSIAYLLLNKVPKEEKEIKVLQLQMPIWTIFNIICALRLLRASDKETKLLFKTGKQLLIHLQTLTEGRPTIGLDEFLLYILQFHHP